VDTRIKSAHDERRNLRPRMTVKGVDMGGYVYIMTNKPNGVLYTGVTNDIARRSYEHREGLTKGFTKLYGCKRLVYYEFYDDIYNAIQREKNIKHWSRAWKVRLFIGSNPEWDDLYETLSH
jgi:putative endonuclease